MEMPPDSETPIRIGTRGSKLALWQAEYVANFLRQAGYPVKLVILSSQGDYDERNLVEIAGEGIFTQTLQRALLSEQIDVAVHSLKDLPTKEVEGITLAAVPPRDSVHDALVSRHGCPLIGLPPGARVGTSSPRREAQLRLLRKDIDVVPIRGNVDTRLAKLDAGEFDAIVLAEAGLNRLGLAARISERFHPRLMLPAPGQGALGIEIRSSDSARRIPFRGIHDHDSHVCVTAERSLLRTLQVGCSAPVGGWCHHILPGKLKIQGAVITADRRFEIELEAELPPNGGYEEEIAIADKLGQEAARAFIGQGAIIIHERNFGA
jgi:hydroxymethylbilane synthase